MKKILVIMAALVALTACKKNDNKLDPKQKVDRDNLTSQVTPGMWKASENVVVYSEANHQLYCGVSKLKSRILNADATKYAEVQFVIKPEVGKDIATAVLVTEGFGHQYDFAATFRVLKIENDLIYIWSDKEAFGAVLYWKE